MMHKTFAPKIASADLWLSQYEGDEVIATMKWYKEKLIAVVKKVIYKP